MADPNLHEGAWQRAVAEAARIYRSSTFGLGVALMEVIVIPLAVLFTASADRLEPQVAIPILAGALALVASIAVVFAIQLIAAPVRQRNELRQAWRTEPVREPVNVELTLRNYARVADDNAKNMSRVGGYSKDDRGRADEWTNEVVDFLSANAPEHARGFIECSEGKRGLADMMYARATKLREIADAVE